MGAGTTHDEARRRTIRFQLGNCASRAPVGCPNWLRYVIAALCAAIVTEPKPNPMQTGYGIATIPVIALICIALHCIALHWLALSVSSSLCLSLSVCLLVSLCLCLCLSLLVPIAGSRIICGGSQSILCTLAPVCVRICARMRACACACSCACARWGENRWSGVGFFKHRESTLLCAHHAVSFLIKCSRVHIVPV